MLTLYVIHADSGTKVNPGHQKNIQSHIGTLKKKKTIKKMQDFLMSFFSGSLSIRYNDWDQMLVSPRFAQDYI